MNDRVHETRKSAVVLESARLWAASRTCSSNGKAGTAGAITVWRHECSGVIGESMCKLKMKNDHHSRTSEHTYTFLSSTVAEWEIDKGCGWHSNGVVILCRRSQYRAGAGITV